MSSEYRRPSPSSVGPSWFGQFGAVFLGTSRSRGLSSWWESAPTSGGARKKTPCGHVLPRGRSERPRLPSRIPQVPLGRLYQSLQLFRGEVNLMFPAAPPLPAEVIVLPSRTTPRGEAPCHAALRITG